MAGKSGGGPAGFLNLQGSSGRASGGSAMIHPDNQFLVAMLVVEALALVLLKRAFKGAQGG